MATVLSALGCFAMTDATGFLRPGTRAARLATTLPFLRNATQCNARLLLLLYGRGLPRGPSIC